MHAGLMVTLSASNSAVAPQTEWLRNKKVRNRAVHETTFFTIAESTHDNIPLHILKNSGANFRHLKVYYYFSPIHFFHAFELPSWPGRRCDLEPESDEWGNSSQQNYFDPLPYHF